MGRVSRVVRLVLVVALCALALALAGCKGKQQANAPQAKVKPPVIGKAGVLRAGLDMSYPPFSSRSQGQDVGLDVDVAAAIADKLGLKLDIVDVKPSEAASAFAGGRIDIALGAQPISQADLSKVSVAGTYVDDGPALFTRKGEETTATALAGKKLAAQGGSAASWKLQDMLGEGGFVEFPTLRECFQAVSDGKTDVAVGDAIVGDYMLRDFSGMQYTGQLGDAEPLAVTVGKDKTDLEEVVRKTMDELASAGVFDAIRSKWAMSLPPLESSVAASTTP